MKKDKNSKKNLGQKARKITPILKIGITITRGQEVLKAVMAHKGNGRPFLIVTPNPEIVLKAQKDPRLAEIINSADFAVPDGVGIVGAMRYREMTKGKKVLFSPLLYLFYGLRVGLSIIFNRKWLQKETEILPGRVLFEQIVREAAKRKERVFLLGAKPGIAARAAEVLRIKYKVSSMRFDTGPWLDTAGKPVDAKQRRAEGRAIKAINRFQPHYLFVGFGAPKQEKWLAKNLPRLKVGKAAMTVGGVLDYYAGRASLPPKILENLGLEWLWRLLREPWRAGRIFKAVFLFPIKVYWYSLTHGGKYYSGEK